MARRMTAPCCWPIRALRLALSSAAKLAFYPLHFYFSDLPVASKNASWATTTTSAAETARKMYTLARRSVAAVLRVLSLLEPDML